MISVRQRWHVAESILLAIWLLAGVIAMYPEVGRALHLSGTVFTSYAADLTQPAWLYLFFRALANPERSGRLVRWLRARAYGPELLAVAIVVGASATEVSQYYWPKGMFRGTFDPLDIAAFASGVTVCWLIDRGSTLMQLSASGA